MIPTGGTTHSVQDQDESQAAISERAVSMQSVLWYESHSVAAVGYWLVGCFWYKSGVMVMVNLRTICTWAGLSQKHENKLHTRFDGISPPAQNINLRIVYQAN